MFDPYDTNAVVNFLADYVNELQAHAVSATGVQKMMNNLDSRVQRRRDAKPVSYTHLTLPTPPYV